jgi:single-strand DNA-binding protein
MFMNRLTLIGFLGHDAEQKFTRNGNPYTILPIATKRSWKDDACEWQSRTEWHRSVVYGKPGEVATTLRKGAHMQIEGELRSREYQKDGAKLRVWECIAESILKLDRAERQEGAATPDAESSADDVPY